MSSLRDGSYGRMPFSVPGEPFQLTNGRIVCRAHYLSVCSRCCFAFPGDSEDESDFEDESHDEDVGEEGLKKVDVGEEESERVTDKDCTNPDQDNFESPLEHRGDGRLICPAIRTFEPPSPTTTPQALFPLSTRGQSPRFGHRSRPREILIYTDGSCLNNGQPHPAAGWAFVFRAPEPGSPSLGVVRGRLEKEGPSQSGEEYPQTSNRAELRAVLAALKFRAWNGEGWSRLVIATDSEYVTRGATKWVRTWDKNGWMTSKGTAVKNKDLWQDIFRAVLVFRQRRMEVNFWRIPRDWNTVADRAAKEGARMEEEQKYGDVWGILC